MKTHWLLVIVCSAALLGCDKSKEEQQQQQITRLETEQVSLQQNIADRDKYFEEVMHSLNEVYADLENVRVKEGQLTEQTGGPESPARITNDLTRQKLLNNIGEIGASLKANRKKIADLQSKVKSFRGELSSLNKLVGNLKQSLQEREQAVAMLETRVKGLETTVAEKTKAVSDKELVIDEQQKTINTGYMIVGTRKELKEKGIISDEGGFLWGLLGSTTVLASGIDRSMFTPIDKTREQNVSVEGKIEEVLPHRSEALFATAHPVENSSVLTIVHPDKFWQDNYLVIVVD